MNVEDMSDEELLALVNAPEDNLKRQKARSKGVDKFAVENLSNEELFAAAGITPPADDEPTRVPRATIPPRQNGTQPYSLTDYSGGKAGRPSDLGPSTEANQRATAAIDDEPGVLDEIFMTEKWQRQPAQRRAADEGRQRTDKIFADAKASPGDQGAQERLRRLSDPVANDPIAQMVLSGTLGAGAGGYVAGGLGGYASGTGLGRALAGGATEGAVGAVAGGVERVQDILPAMLLGAGQRGASRPIAPHAPRTQAELDAAAFAKVGARPPSARPGAKPRGGAFDTPEYQALPAGEHGTVKLASDADRVANQALDARASARDASIHAAEGAAAQRLKPYRYDTAPEIAELQRIRQQGIGARPNDPLMPEGDRRLEFTQRQLQRPVENLSQDERAFALAHPQHPMAREINKKLASTRELSFEEMRAVQKALNDRLRSRSGSDLELAGDRQAADVISRGVREFDAPDSTLPPGVQGPTRPQGEFGRALDRYGAESDAIREATENLGSGQEAVSRIARVGKEDAGSQTGIQEAGRVAKVQQQIPESAKLIDIIRARNVAQRRGYGMPSLLGVEPVAAVARTLLHNPKNIAFRLKPPRIDANGMVAGRQPGMIPQLAIPLELQALLQAQQEGRE